VYPVAKPGTIRNRPLEDTVQVVVVHAGTPRRVIRERAHTSRMAAARGLVLPGTLGLTRRQVRAGQHLAGCLQCQGACNAELVAGIDAASVTLRPRAQRIQLAVKLDVGFDDASASVTRFEGEQCSHKHPPVRGWLFCNPNTEESGQNLVDQDPLAASVTTSSSADGDGLLTGGIAAGQANGDVLLWHPNQATQYPLWGAENMVIAADLASCDWADRASLLRMSGTAAQFRHPRTASLACQPANGSSCPYGSGKGGKILS